MTTDIKPNFSSLAAEFKASRNTIKKYYNMKDGDNPRKARTYKSVFDPYEDFIRERAQNVAGCTYAALFMLLNDRYPAQKGRAKYGAFTAFCRRKKIIIGRNDAKAHVLFETAPGHQLQVDWKEDITVHTTDGKELYFNIFSATLGASRYHVYIYTIGKTRSDFFRCVRMALIKIGGSVDEILTDNMAAIVKITSETKNGRKKYPDVLQWEKDSGIRIRLCKPRSPETKGKVEVSNKFVDRIKVYDGQLRDEDELLSIVTSAFVIDEASSFGMSSTRVSFFHKDHSDSSRFELRIHNFRPIIRRKEKKPPDILSRNPKAIFT